MRLEDFAGRRVALWGLGREGESTFRALRRLLPDLDVTLLSDTPLDARATHALAGDEHIHIVTGPEAIAAALPEFDVIVKSPGVSLYRDEVRDAQRQGVLVTSATRLWFAEHPNARTVCVTGTKGKSTTASLIAHLLDAAGLRAELRGNIGRPLMDPVTTEPDAWVIELSSYQCADLVADPSVAILLNLFPEHLDWHGDVATYFRDKMNLFMHQRDGIAVVNCVDPQIAHFSKLFNNPTWFNGPQGFHVEGDHIHLDQQPVMTVSEIGIPGSHNHSNICAALAAVQALEPSIDPASLRDGVASFRGLPHRLMPLGEKDGVLYVDDSISTTPESAMAAIEAFSGRPVTVLLGGFERLLPYEELVRFVTTRDVQVVTLPPSGQRIAESIRRLTDASRLVEAQDLEEAVAAARRLTSSGGVVLLSPAAPSYGAFRNFKERGKAFARIAGFQ